MISISRKHTVATIGGRTIQMVLWIAFACLQTILGWPSTFAQCDARWHQGEGQSFPGVFSSAGSVSARAMTSWDPDGVGPLPPMLVLGGFFDFAGNVPVANIAAWDGTDWHPLGTGIQATSAGASVTCVGTYRGHLIAAGNFTSAGNALASRIAKWDGNSWQALGSGVNGLVNAVLEWNDELYVGGSFTLAGGTSVRGLARWNGQAWADVPTGLTSFAGAPINILSLRVYNSQLHVGGDFGISGAVGARLARLDGTTWRDLGAAECGAILSMAVYHDELVVAGSVTVGSTYNRNRISRWDGSSWHAFPEEPNSVVNSLTVHGDLLVLGGDFITASQQWTGNRVVGWNGSSWVTFGQGLSGNPVLAVVSHRGELFACGLFNYSITEAMPNGSAIRGAPMNGISRWTGQGLWQPLTQGMNQSVTALGEFNNEVVAATSFAFLDGTEASSVVGWNGFAWHRFGDGLNSPIRSIATFQNELIVGGTFGVSVASSITRIARWDGSSWQSLGGGVGGTASGLGVLAMTLFQGDLIVSGRFSTAGGFPANNIARWNGAAWSPLGAGTNGDVRSLIVYQGELVAGGAFTTAGGAPAMFVARWDGTTWRPLSTGANSTVRALCIFNTDLIAGGSFTVMGGQPVQRVSRWDGASWSPLASGLTSTVTTLRVFQGRVVAGGAFVGPNADINNIAEWNGISWGPLERGVNAPVQALYEFGGELIVGGDFQTASGLASPYFTRWGPETTIPGVTRQLDHVRSCPTGNATFVLTTRGTPPFTFSWTKNGVLLDHSNPRWSSTTSADGRECIGRLTNLTMADAGVYSCSIANACGLATSEPAILTICPADIDNGLGTGVCDGGVTIDDLVFFLAAFEAGDVRTDVDDGSGTGSPDGGLTVDDLLYFLQRFEAGC